MFRGGWFAGFAELTTNWGLSRGGTHYSSFDCVLPNFFQQCQFCSNIFPLVLEKQERTMYALVVQRFFNNLPIPFEYGLCITRLIGSCPFHLQVIPETWQRAVGALFSCVWGSSKNFKGITIARLDIWIQCIEWTSLSAWSVLRIFL